MEIKVNNNGPQHKVASIVGVTGKVEVELQLDVLREKMEVYVTGVGCVSELDRHQVKKLRKFLKQLL